MIGKTSTQREGRPTGADAASIEAVLQAMKDAHGEGPGRFLKQLREAMSLSETEAASRLSMNVSQVRSLEINDFERLPAPIFVRSFLQRYAGLVGLPKEQVQQAYDRLGVNQTPSLTSVSPPRERRAESKPLPKKWFSYVAAGIIVLVAAWIISTLDFSSKLAQEPEAAAEGVAPAAAPAATSVEIPSAAGTVLTLPPPPQPTDPADLEPKVLIKTPATR